MTACHRPYRGRYDVRTAPCSRAAGHLGFCQFEAMGSSVVREAVLTVGTLLLLALGLAADGWAAWGWGR